MIAASFSCNCNSENPSGVFIEPIKIIYNKLINEKYFSYGEQFTKDIFSGNEEWVTYGGYNPNFLGFFYWLYGPLGLVVVLLIFIALDIYLKSCQTILRSDPVRRI